MKEKLHIGDSVKIYRNQDKATCIIGKVSFINNTIIKVGPSIYNPETKELELKKYKQLIPDCTLEVSKEAREVLETLAIRDLMYDEIYFFLNNDKKRDHLDPDRIDSALRKLTLEELTKITEVMLPYGMGECGFKNIEELKNRAKRSKTDYCILYL